MKLLHSRVSFLKPPFEKISFLLYQKSLVQLSDGHQDKTGKQ